MNVIFFFVLALPGSGRTSADVSSSSSSGVGSGSGTDSGGLPTLVVVALVVGVPVLLVLMCGITYYFKSERRIRARKEGVAGVGHHQRHHHHQREIKDLSLTAPCLPRGGGDHPPPPPPTQPPQPPESASIHHRFQPPPSCMPYSVSRPFTYFSFYYLYFLYGFHSIGGHIGKKKRRQKQNQRREKVQI